MNAAMIASPIQKASADARFLSQALANSKDATVTYEVLSGAIGRDVRKHAYGALQTALRIVLRDHSMVFEAVPNVGYRRLTSAEIVETQAGKAFASMGRVSRRTARKIHAADYNSLTREQRTAHNAQLSMLGVIGHMTKPSALLNVERETAKESNELPVGKTLALFIGGPNEVPRMTKGE